MFVDRFFNFLNRRKRFPYIFVSPLLYAIGNCAEEIYFGLLKARKENKKLIILRPYYTPFILGYRICNKELFNIRSVYCNIRFRIIIEHFFKMLFSLIFIPLRILSLAKKTIWGNMLPIEYNFPRVGFETLWQGSNREHKFHWRTVRLLKWKNQFESPIKVSITEKRHKRARDELAELGVTDDDWFVCLHVREGGFRKDHVRRPYRNADIYNYLPAINEIVDQGGWVIRMGDSTMKPLPAIRRVIDYPFTPYKSEWMDLYLIKECRFYIGCQSGIYDAAVLFNKRILLVNMYNWTFGYPLRKGDLGIIKHVYSKRRKRYLSVKELFVGPWDLQNTAAYLGEDYEMIENQPEEIRELTVEFLDKQSRSDYSDLQAEANKVRIKHSYMLFSSGDQPLGENIRDMPLAQQYRYASRIETSMGVLGQKFLEKNWETNSNNI